MTAVRTRIAPSPTGDPHVGTAYIALFNLCFARHHGGRFLLRIEDTDQLRSTPDSEQAIIAALRWLGLEWDEGPDVGGAHGPYRQSERGLIYHEHIEQLLDSGHAFHCFCSEERLTVLREQQRTDQEAVGYDGCCLALSQDEITRRLTSGEPHVVRMRVPREGVCRFDDMLRGEIEIDWAQIDMQVLRKADGMPTYHLASVVDDYRMAISHVIRGEEWISSTPKHVLLYQYLGWQPPVFCHLPLLRNPDKTKLSKRKNPTGILYYQRMGFLPEALLNYLGRMGWSMPDEREKFRLDEMIAHFDIGRVSLGGPIFDIEKLRWLNSVWIREDLDDEMLADRLVQWAYNRSNLLAFLPHARQRMEVFSDLAPLGGYLVSGMLALTPADFDATGIAADEQLRNLQFALWRLEALRHWQRELIFDELTALAGLCGCQIRAFLPPLFVAIAGTTASISVMDSMVLLGADMTRARLRHAIEVLGGLGKKKRKKLEKEYAVLGSARSSAEAPADGG